MVSFHCFSKEFYNSTEKDFHLSYKSVIDFPFKLCLLCSHAMRHKLRCSSHIPHIFLNDSFSKDAVGQFEDSKEKLKFPKWFSYVHDYKCFHNYTDFIILHLSSIQINSWEIYSNIIRIHLGVRTLIFYNRQLNICFHPNIIYSNYLCFKYYSQGHFLLQSNLITQVSIFMMYLSDWFKEQGYGWAKHYWISQMSPFTPVY